MVCQGFDFIIKVKNSFDKIIEVVKRPRIKILGS